MKVTVTYLKQEEVEINDKYQVLLDDDFENWYPVEHEMVKEVCDKLNIKDRYDVECIETEEGIIYE
jgi:hypothetical protein